MEGLEGSSVDLGCQHQVHILGSASQILKFVILHTCIAEMFNFIEVDGYASLQDGWPLGGEQ